MNLTETRQTAAVDFKVSQSKRFPVDGGTAPVQAANLVAIEALGVLGTRNGGCRVSVSGWALATDAITKLELSLGPKVIATAFYGVPRPDVARLYPACAAAGHCGFIAKADLPTAASGTVELMLTVRTVDGRVDTSPLRIDIPPQQLATAGRARLSFP